MPGRHRKLTKLKKIQGTNRKDRSIGKEVELNPLIELPAVPNYFKAPAKNEWIKITSELFEQEILAKVDLRVLEEYCFQFDIIEDAKEGMEDGPTIKIKNNGGGNSVVKNPAFTVYAEAFDRMYRLAPHFGLTPVSRTKLPAPKKKEEPPQKLLGMIG